MRFQSALHSVPRPGKAHPTPATARSSSSPYALVGGAALLVICLLGGPLAGADPPSPTDAAGLAGGPGQDLGAMTDAGAQSPEILITSSTPGGLELEFAIPSLQVSKVGDSDGTVQEVRIPGGGITGVPGEAEIPTFSRLLYIPPGTEPVVTTRILDSEEKSGVRLSKAGAAANDSIENLPPTGSGEPAKSNAPVYIGEPASLRGLPVAPIVFRPVTYDPERETMRVARRMSVRISFVPAPDGKKLDGNQANGRRPGRLRPIPPSFDALYRHTLVNYERARAGREIAPGSWVVICPDDPQVLTRLQPLVDWRMRLGMAVRVATTAETGTTKEAIKAWLQDAYDTWDVPPEFVALAGDATGSYQIPTWLETTSSYNGEGDLPYAQLDGTDVLSDVHVGRISFVSLTELEAIVAKIVHYESAPEMSDPDWFRRACLMADLGGSGGWGDRLLQLVNLERLQQLGYAQVDTVFYPPFLTQMATSINHGDGILCYRGTFRFSGWTNAQTYSLTNGWKLPFVIALTCETGSFYRENSALTEGFLRANLGVNDPKGAIGAIGMATGGTHTRYNNCLTFGIMYGLLHEEQTTLGAALDRGKLEMFANYEATEPQTVLLASHWTNLMGDPAVDCWTGTPQVLAVTHPASVPVGANSVIVQVERNGLPEPGLLVCLWDGAQGQWTGKTDAAGRAEVAVQAVAPGSLALTVTGHDRHPYLASISVLSSEPLSIGFGEAVVDDDSSGESQGNGDGQVNPGEQIELRVALQSFGSSVAPAVGAALVCDDPYVTVTDAAESYGDIAPGAIAWCPDDFGFTLSPACPAGHTIRLGLDIQSGVAQWHALIDLYVIAPDLTATGTSVSDPGGNGRLDPGETGDVVVTLRNSGGLDASAVTGTLTSTSAWISVLGSTGGFGDILAGQSGTNALSPFQVSVAAGAYPGYDAYFDLVTACNGGLPDTTRFDLRIGQAGTTDPAGPDPHGYYAFDNTDAAYAGSPAYQWVELDPTLGGSGTELPLSDLGGLQDVSGTVDLPFTFGFYGRSFNEATICSNGWLSLGSTRVAEYRNWSIPGVGAPANLLAAFWDDLYRASDSKILYRYDAAGHRWIVEWGKIRNAANNAVETFEAILYNPAWYPTASGDGIILYQYQTVANVDAEDGYATVGIQNADRSAGLLYTYFNLYQAGAATLSAGRAIRIVPVLAPALGRIEGTITNASHGGTPATGVEVRALGQEGFSRTDAAGRYALYLPPGTYTLVAGEADYQSETVSDVVIPLAPPVTVDFALIDAAGPRISGVSQPMHTPSTGPTTIDARVADQSGVAAVALFWRKDEGSWTEAPMAPVGDLFRGTVPGAAAGSRIDYYLRAQDGIGLARTAPPSAPDSSFGYWVSQTVYAWDMEDPASAGWLLGVPGDDAGTGKWWRGIPEGWYASNGWPLKPAADHTPAPGQKCFVTGQSTGTLFYGCTTLQSPVFNLSGGRRAFVHYWRWYSELVSDDVDEQFSAYVSNDGGGTWVPIEGVEHPAISWTSVDIAVHDYVALSNQVVFRFRACETADISYIAAALDDISLELVPYGPATTPDQPVGAMEFTLYPIQPNPQGMGSTMISFSLPRPGAVRLDVYDVGGRLIRRLVDGVRPAGRQSVAWDGCGESGAPAGTGVCFCRLQSGDDEQVQRIVRIR